MLALVARRNIEQKTRVTFLNKLQSNGKTQHGKRTKVLGWKEKSFLLLMIIKKIAYLQTSRLTCVCYAHI